MTQKEESFALALTHLPSAQKIALPCYQPTTPHSSIPPTAKVRPFNCYIQQVNYLNIFASLARKIKYPFTGGSAGAGFWHRMMTASLLFSTGYSIISIASLASYIQFSN